MVHIFKKKRPTCYLRDYSRYSPCVLRVKRQHTTYNCKCENNISQHEDDLITPKNKKTLFHSPHKESMAIHPLLTFDAIMHPQRIPSLRNICHSQQRQILCVQKLVSQRAELRFTSEITSVTHPRRLRSDVSRAALRRLRTCGGRPAVRA
jgi:hypothetical protein